MSRVTRIGTFLASAVVAFGVLPTAATAGPHGGGHHGGGRPSGGHQGGYRGSHGTVPRGGSFGGHASRSRVRDHRGVAPTQGHYPYAHHQTYRHWPSYYGYGYRPYYGLYDGYYDGYYQPYYYGPPSTAEVVTAPPPRRRSHLGVAAHVGQLERDDGLVAGMAGLSLRWRGRALEGEVELGRRVYADSDLVERSLGATVYLNLGDPDVLHPYLLAGAGVLDTERMFGAVGAGLALPLASRLSLAGDLRATSTMSRMHQDDRMTREDRTGAVEGRLGLIVDF